MRATNLPRAVTGAALLLTLGMSAEAAAQPPAAAPPATSTPPPGAPPGAAGPPVFEDVHVTPAPDGAVAGAPAPPPPVALPPAPEPTGAAKEAPKPKPSGYAEGEGFILRSEDDNYKLRIGFQGAYKFEPVHQNGEWENRRAFFVLRPILAGNLYKDWIRFWTSLELASNPPYVLDSYVEINPEPEIGVRIGQQYTLLSRHEQFGPQQILFPEWAPVAEYFWTGRDKGVTAWGNVAKGLFEYYAGTYSGTPLRQFQVISGNYVVSGRVVWNPLGPTAATEFPYILKGGSPTRVSGSLQGYYGKVQLAEENFNQSSFRFDVVPTGDIRKQMCGAADVWLQASRFVFLVEGYVRQTKPDMTASKFTSIGVWGQAGVMIVDRLMDVSVRVNWLNPSTTLGSDRFISGEAQVAWYITSSPMLVLKLRYGIADQQTPGMDALGAVPLVLPAGRTQLVTGQLNVAF